MKLHSLVISLKIDVHVYIGVLTDMAANAMFLKLQIRQPLYKVDTLDLISKAVIFQEASVFY